MRITKKLGILVAVPLCAVSGFGALALVTSASGAVSAGRLYTLMNSAKAAGDLVTQLQAERTQVAMFLSGAKGVDTNALNDQIAKTQAATAFYESKLKGMPWLSSDGQALLSRIDGELRAIDTLRDLIRGQSPQALSAADFQYHIVIADLLSFHDLAENSGASAKVATMLRATASLSQAREALSGEEADVLRTVGAPAQTASAVEDLIGSRSAYSAAMESFAALAPASWKGVPDQVLRGQEMAFSGQLEDSVAQTPVGEAVRLDLRNWTGTLDARLDRLDSVRQDMDEATLTLIAHDRSHQRELAGVEAAGIAGTVLLALMVSLRLGRPIIKGLRSLREGAHTVAFEDLPAAVQALRGSGSLTGQSPEEFADEAGGGLQVLGDDEIAAVARAFNAVRREAIWTAAEQVLLRAGVGAAFVALARRGERLTGALTLELDKAERDEQDPDRLARLFVLDHLAARMTRNNESLLVLGGEGTVRVRDEGVPLIDVIRAASGRIERYSRVDLVNVDMSVVVAPPAVDHLVHLCAELLDNATAFSSPDSRVVVDMRALADRIILQIADRGIGMTPRRRSELNARLTTPTHLDAASVKAMGLTVVGQLASWYGIAVELRPNPLGGTIAELVLPPTLYWAPGSPDPGTSSAPLPAMQTLASGMGQPGPRAERPSVGTQAGTAAGGRRRRSAAPDPDAEPFAAAAGGFEPRHGTRPPAPYPAMPQQPAMPWQQAAGSAPAPGTDETGQFAMPRPGAADGSPWQQGVRSPVEATGIAMPRPGEADGSPWQQAAGPGMSGTGDFAMPRPGAADGSPWQQRAAGPGLGGTGDFAMPRPGDADGTSWQQGVRSPMEATGEPAAQRPGAASGPNGFPPAPIRVRPLSRPGGGPVAAASAASGGEPLSPWLGALRSRASAPQAPSYQDQDQDQDQDQNQARPPSFQQRSAFEPPAQPSYQPRPAFEPPAPPSYQGAAAGQASFGPRPSFQSRSTPVAAPSFHVRPALPTAFPAPAPGPGAGAPLKPKTTHGLPKRVPLARLPADAMTDTPEAQAADPAERDPSKVSASMVAYARGIGGHGAPGIVPPTPYTPTSTNGTF